MTKKSVSGTVAGWMDSIHTSVQNEYGRQNRILSFDEYLELVKEAPTRQLRSSSQYLLDTMNHFGKEGARWNLFDQKFADERFRLIDQDHVQERIHQILRSFVREGANNKLILLHGPNGSAKSSIINCLIRGMEHYSETPDGALYRFHWIFPADRFGKSSLGLGGGAREEDSLTSFANLPDADIAARITCELRDHPVFLVPLHQRGDFLAGLSLPDSFTVSEYIRKGDLSQKSKQIFEALLRAYKGDYRKVLRHIQVERFYVSKRYHQAATAVEPQMHVDAQARQITMDRSAAMLPSSLQFLSLFDLQGELVDGNRGIIEYNDLLKRPIDAFKYLLTTTETGVVSVGGTVAFLDTVLIGTCNEAQLDAFKEYPDFPSFKARIELVRVPYLLNFKREEEIYSTQIERVAGDRHVTPHTLAAAARWAVLCRLKKPNPSHYPSSFSYLVNSLTPWEKARFLSEGLVPPRLNSEERKTLKSHAEDIRLEYTNVPYYEGRMGPSPREMKIILFNALERNARNILSPLSLFQELEEFVKRTSEYDYLREDVVEGYHDCKNFISVAREAYLDEVDSEVRGCLGVHDDVQYEGFLRKYVQNVTAVIKKEKIKNPVTGRAEDPDKFLLEEFERIVGVTEDRDGFRQNLLTQVGVYALEHQKGGGQMDYARVFPDLIKRIRDHYIDEHKSLLKRIYDVITLFERPQDGASQGSPTPEQIEAEKHARSMLERMQQKHAYNEISAREAFLYLVQKRY